MPLTEADRRILVKYGLRIKDRLGEVVSIAKPETLLAWHRRQKQQKWTFGNRAQAPGRPRKSEDTEALVLRLAEQNGAWGYKRISGELKMLGHSACPGYVREVLRRHGLPPAPHRRGPSWKQFLQSHLDVTWAADFLTEEVWTMGGLMTFYILFFLHLGSRRVWIAGATPQPQHAPDGATSPKFYDGRGGMEPTLPVFGPRPRLQFYRSGSRIKTWPTHDPQNAATRTIVQCLR